MTPSGVFVTGTDTEIGKTLTSALLVRAWNASYWKPLQTGLADEAGDTPTVAALARLTPERFQAPAYALQAPLAPYAAAKREDIRIDPDRLVLPTLPAPLVVEGAGGLMVPICDSMMMIDLIAQLGLPVVLVARSGLGTINHTLLSLEALQSRNIPVCGVVLSGPPSPENARDITTFGRSRILFELPRLPEITPETLDRLAETIPPLEQCLPKG